MEQQINGVEQRNIASVAELKACLKGIEVLLEKQGKTHEKIAYMLEQHEDRLKQHDEAIDELQAVPAKKWERAVERVITVLQGVAVAWLIAVLINKA